MTTLVYDGMTISDNPSRIIKVPEAKYVLQGIKGIFDKDIIYLVASVVAYCVSASVGLN